MSKTIDAIVSGAKNIIRGIALASLVSCAATYAKKDYDRYPAHRREIALYNMREIAKDFCRKPFPPKHPYCENMSFDETGLSFTRYTCIHRYQSAHGGWSCDQTKDSREEIRWGSVRKIVPLRSAVKVCDEKADCTKIPGFKNRRQAADFAEAMSIYLK